MSLFQSGASAPERVPRNAARFHHRMAESPTNDMYCDVMITCRGQKFKAVKFVLCQQSEVFASMLTGNFKEAKEGIVDLPDDDPDTIGKLLEFCHRFTYTLAPPTTSTHIVRHIRLYVAGDKYMIPELCDMALSNFRNSCLTSWHRFVFAEAIEEAYLRCDHPIFQELVCAVAIAAYGRLAGNREQYPSFWETVLKTPEFARDMLLEIPKSRADNAGRPYICSQCAEVLMLSLRRPGEGYPHQCSKRLFGPWYVRQADCQELFLNTNGKMVGGVAHGFNSDEASGSQVGSLFGRSLFGRSTVDVGNVSLSKTFE